MPGKEPKGKKKSGGRGARSLYEDIHSDRFASTKGNKDVEVLDEDDDNGGGFLIPDHTTQRILQAARRQLHDDEEEGGKDVRPARLADDDDDDDDDVEEDNQNENDDEEDEEAVEIEYDDHESVATEVQDFGDMGDEYEIDEEESRLLDKFQPSGGGMMQSRNLADIIMAKIKEKEIGATEMGGGGGGEDGDDMGSEAGGQRIDRRVAKVYASIGGILKHYSSGKIPKAFKMLPHIQNWEQLLVLTKPHDWSPHATYSATRIFAAHLNERMAQRFYVSILLPIVHDHMQENRKLHPALYMAIRKALFKPIAFYKGFLIPLAQDGECSLREALVIASVLQKMHLPPTPTAVALVKISQLPFSGPNCVFLRVMIDKKMALPFQAVDALVKHFHRFVTTHRKDEALPVLWHQTLLSFVQRYKGSLMEEQFELLKQVCSKHFHYLITPEIRREMAIAQGHN